MRPCVRCLRALLLRRGITRGRALHAGPLAARADAQPARAAQVVDAMRSTISGMLGTLPPQFFDVSVNASGESLAQLMFSVLMTGYLLCNAQCAAPRPLQLAARQALRAQLCGPSR